MENEKKLHAQFLTEVVEHGKVWGLKVEENWAVSKSDSFKDAEVLLFWGTENAAKICAEDDWNDYVPSSVDLYEFLENWLPGMYDEGIAVGTNWTKELEGLEMDPVSLALEIIDEIKASNIKYIPHGYDSLSEFEAELHEMGEDI